MNPTLPFSTQVEVSHSMYGNTYKDAYTNTLANLTYTGDGTPFEDYALGYIKTDDMPDVYRRSKIDFDLGNDKLTCDYATPDGNYPCGYMSTQGQSVPTYFSECSWSNGNLINHGQCNQWRFINNCYPEFSELGPATNSNTFQLHLLGCLYMGADSTPFQSQYGVTISLSDIEYFKGLISSQGIPDTHYYTANVTYQGTTYNISLPFDFNSFANIEVHINDANGSGIYFNGFIVGYTFRTTGCMNFFVVEVPEIDSEFGYNRKWIVGGNSWAGTNSFAKVDATNISNITITYNMSSHNLSNTSTGAFGGLQCEFPITGLGGVASNGVYLTKSGNVGCFRQQGLNNVHYLRRIFTVDEIKQLFDIALYRESLNNTSVNSYVVGRSTAIQVDIDDRFKCEQKEGNITDDAFKDGLRYWQYIDRVDSNPEDNGFATNDFDPDTDIPEYTPDEPVTPEGDNPDNPDMGVGNTDDTPDDDIEEDKMNDGRIVYCTNKFITQYILSITQLARLGETMWSGLLDPNTSTFLNFFAVYSDTGTLNLSNLMDAFISLRVFPFAFNSALINQYPDLRVGTGATALLNETVNVYVAFNAVVDCGTVNAVAEGFTLMKNSYDFRNYYNATISAFLPYCGTVELNPSDVFGRELSCRYYVDTQSGTCTAVIYVNRGGARLMVASKSGQIGFLVPLTATNAGQVTGMMFSDVGNIAQTIGQTLLTKGIGTSIPKSGYAINQLSDNKISNESLETSSVMANTSGGLIGGLGNVLSRAGAGFPSLSGGTGIASMCFDSTPYITIRRSDYSSPNNYGVSVGYCCTDGSKTIGDYKGWCKFKNVKLSDVHGTLEELNEIERLLEAGIYI